LQEKIAFVSNMFGYSWGGCEELWSRTALELAAQGFAVSASVREWSPPHSRILNLIEGGVEVWFRPQPHPVWRHAWRVLAAPNQMWKHAWRLFTKPQQTATTTEVERLLAARRPGLVVISDAGAFPPIDLLELCVDRRLPFVTIHHANTEAWWVDDDPAERYRVALAAAQRCYFVSKANQRLIEKQIGCELSNAEVVWNPVNMDRNTSPAWPPLGRDDEFRLACVARLDPPSKGQDILFEALAGPSWAARRWRLYLYGEGPMRNSLERLVQHLGLSDRVVFAGYVSVEHIWASNHVLVMPSRFEGLPLTIVEAMLCGRPVVATDVAGNSEVIEDGVTGFLADAPTVASMAEALERFWARRVDAQIMGQAGSKRIRQLLPTDPVRVFSDKLARIYKSSRGPSYHRAPMNKIA
jgi:glycosyltransferase involved in cell wall biosynthesis